MNEPNSLEQLLARRAARLASATTPPGDDGVAVLLVNGNHPVNLVERAQARSVCAFASLGAPPPEPSAAWWLAALAAGYPLRTFSGAVALDPHNGELLLTSSLPQDALDDERFDAWIAAFAERLAAVAAVLMSVAHGTADNAQPQFA